MEPIVSGMTNVGNTYPFRITSKKKTFSFIFSFRRSGFFLGKHLNDFKIMY